MRRWPHQQQMDELVERVKTIIDCAEIEGRAGSRWFVHLGLAESGEEAR